MYGSTQSQSFVVPGLANLIGITPNDLVYIAETCGGGFGSKGTEYPVMAIPAHMAKKIGRPVMLRITRHEEFFIGSARHGFQGRIRMGFRRDGKLTAADLFIVQEHGPYQGFSDYTSAAEAVSIVYTPTTMRFRGIPVMTNTPPRGPQRGPGQNQIAMAVEPLLDKAARQLGVDPLAIRRINAPDSNWRYGGQQGGLTSAYLREALDKGAAAFNYAARAARNGERNGSKVRATAIGQAYHSAGFRGLDRTLAIDRLAERVDDATEKTIPDRDFGDAVGAADLIALVDFLRLAEDRGADVVLLEVQHHSVDAVGELEQLA